MTQKEYDDLLVKIYGPRNKHLRLGQWAMICLPMNIYLEITGRECDCFFRDELLESCLEKIKSFIVE